MSAVAESRVAIAETRHMRRGGDGVESAACVEVEMAPRTPHASRWRRSWPASAIMAPQVPCASRRRSDTVDVMRCAHVCVPEPDRARPKPGAEAEPEPEPEPEPEAKAEPEPEAEAEAEPEPEDPERQDGYATGTAGWW
jgi:hypothetical protein